MKTDREKCASSLGAAKKKFESNFPKLEQIFAGRAGFSSAQICTYICIRDTPRLLKNGRHRLRYLCIGISRGETILSFFLVTKHPSIFSAFFVARKNRMLVMAKEIATTIRTYLSPPFVLRTRSTLSKSNKDSRADHSRRPVRTLNFSRLEYIHFSLLVARTLETPLVPRYM